MKAYDFTNWEKTPECNGLLFFVQSLEELLFHFGHDSLKVPALNFHFLCIEISKTIDYIEKAIIDKGNLIPLFEELIDSYKKDPMVIKLFGEDPNSLFYQKNSKNEYIRNCDEIYKDCTTESSMKKIKATINYLIEEMKIDGKYYSLIKKQIEEKISNFSLEDNSSNELYVLTRIWLTELINIGYSQEYIYYIVKDLFYKKRLINDVKTEFNQFWRVFDFKNKTYIAYLPVEDNNFLEVLKTLRIYNILPNTYFSKVQAQWVIEIEIDDYDPYGAREKSLTLLNFIMSLSQFGSHKEYTLHENSTLIIDKEASKKYYIFDPVKPVQRGRDIGIAKIKDKTYKMFDHFGHFRKMVPAISLHSLALNSSDPGNQLLNLWTIIEVLIEVERNNSFSRINQICNALIPILNLKYINSLIEQLNEDLSRCCIETINSSLKTINEGSSKDEKLAAILVLPKYDSVFDKILSSLGDYPLLVSRMKKYKREFSSRKNIKSILENRRKRLRWQIMRIYRNRNMVVHDGNYMEYNRVIIQNLHFYVDCLIEMINHYAGLGYRNTKNIFSAINMKEYKYLMILEEVDSDKLPKTINDIDFISTVLNK